MLVASLRPRPLLGEEALPFLKSPASFCGLSCTTQTCISRMLFREFPAVSPSIDLLLRSWREMHAQDRRHASPCGVGLSFSFAVLFACLISRFLASQSFLTLGHTDPFVSSSEVSSYTVPLM